MPFENMLPHGTLMGGAGGRLFMVWRPRWWELTLWFWFLTRGRKHADKVSITQMLGTAVILHHVRTVDYEEYRAHTQRSSRQEKARRGAPATRSKDS